MTVISPQGTHMTTVEIHS